MQGVCMWECARLGNRIQFGTTCSYMQLRSYVLDVPVLPMGMNCFYQQGFIWLQARYHCKFKAMGATLLATFCCAPVCLQHE